MTIVSKPSIEYRNAIQYMGIRIQTPMKGLSRVFDELRAELAAWVRQQPVIVTGQPFRRYHVIDMAGEMDIELGIPVAQPLPHDSRVSAGVLPAGYYARLIYCGSGLSGNKALLDWARANGIVWDRWNDPKGDAFRSRYETYLTDPKREPRKTKWEIEVAIKLAENKPQVGR
ncbi:MAG TPA: GyrI-like domain-containing protein [Roseiflexaceae bacterium]|nr:GyrI-like domain-containing protein [Roseiflexaceae bacterium]